MKQQILVIHGGDTFQSYDVFLENLRSKEISLQRLRSKSWKDTLENDLGVGYEVIAPRMPNAQNARYEEWKIWFEKIMVLLNEGLILLGHSLGGIFLAKYLSEQAIAKRIKAVFLIAAPFDEDCDFNLKEFAFSDTFHRLADLGSKVVLYHSKDDPVVPFNELLKYEKALPLAELKIFEDRQHFNQETFLEIVGDIRRWRKRS
jgi:predicted alpha/beta hydrolase family esterase